MRLTAKSFGALRLPRALGSLFLAGCLLTGSVALHGCGGGASAASNKIDPTTGTTTTYQMVQPTLTNISPNNVSLGDTITVFGKDFIDKAHGQLSLYMQGTFTSANNDESRYETTIPLKYVSPGQATFDFGPDIFFSKSGKDLGTFNGTFQVISKLTTPAVNADVGATENSVGQDLAITAQQSIYVSQLRSVDADCPIITPGTTPGNNMAIGIELLGVDAATPDNPTTLTYSFSSPGLVATYVEAKPYAYWPFTGDGAGTPTYDTTGQVSFSFNITSGISAVVDPRHGDPMTITVSPPVALSQIAQNTTTVVLARLSAGKADALATGNANFMNVTVTATRADGTAVARTINMPIYSAIHIGTPSTMTLGGREDPQPAGDCVTGSTLGNDYQYTEGSSATRSKSVNLTWNNSFMNSGTLQIGSNDTLSLGIPFIGAANINWNASASATKTWTEAFSVDQNISVSSEDHKGFTESVHILPKQYAVSYRQAKWYQSTAPMLVHTACGDAVEAGTATLHNPQWAFDIQFGPVCNLPTSPASILDPAWGDVPSSSGN